MAINSKNRKALRISLFFLIGIVILGIGYASISSINLIINGNLTASADQNNFKVKFLSETGVTPTIEGSPTNTISIDSDTISSFNISTLDRKDQSVTATYKVKNVSSGIGASIDLQLTNSNTEYFKVTEKILDDTLQVGEETTVIVKVEMLKTPIDCDVTTTITAKLIASPLENVSAIDGNEKEEVRPVDPYTYVIGGINSMYIGVSNELDSSTRTYSSFTAAKTAFGHPAVLALKIESGSITESNIAFERNGKVYKLKRPTVNESSLDEKPTYNSNVLVLKNAFGPDWQSVCNDYGNTFTCSSDGLTAEVNGGDISVGGSDISWRCSAYSVGIAGCS